MLQGSYVRETVLKFCLREPKQWQKSVLRKHEPTLFHFVPKLTACLHQEQLIATISLLWKENFCWKPWDVMTRDREFKTTPITERVCSPKAQSEHRQNSSPDSRSLYSKWHVQHLRSPPFPHRNSLFLNQLERGGTSICCTANYSKRVDFSPQMNEVLICSYY